MSTERDELLSLVEQMRPKDRNVIPGGRWPATLVDQILAAGWRKPRTITTLDELMNLSANSVIRSTSGDVLELGTVECGVRGRWAIRAGFELDRIADGADLPATVLWTPGEGQ